MTTRSWTELKDINGSTYILQYTSVDTHEGATVGGFFLLRLESEQELKEFKEHEFKCPQRREFD